MAAWVSPLTAQLSFYRKELVHKQLGPLVQSSVQHRVCSRLDIQTWRSGLCLGTPIQRCLSPNPAFGHDILQPPPYKTAGPAVEGIFEAHPCACINCDRLETLNI
ncbi:hypothetical protein KIL84_016024 [Mauremys mutica]|uniref:Uncharacterized protein n=1 Tax=Mauremys mutica TaxID=74926 RepID=A0A9D3WRR1_9SAUR|nr:hypothetical protein KIL84_016024 [Mauremys mutica]